MHAGKGIHVTLMKGTFTPTANMRNNYGMDRAGQMARKTFSGVYGVGVQDAAVQESMGPVQDRAREQLVSSDNNIIMARRRLREAAEAVARGVAPPGLDPQVQRERAMSMVVSRELSLLDAIAQNK